MSPTTRKNLTRLKAKFLSRKGFSLVEVAMALGIMAFSFSVMFGLLGVGLTNFRQSKAVSVSAQIAQQVFSQMQSIPFDTLVATSRSSAATMTNVKYTNSMTVNGGSTVSKLYFDEMGNQLSTNNGVPPSGTVYTVNVRVAFPTPILPSTASSPTVLNIDLATILVQVALNPNNAPVATDPLDTSGTKWADLSKQIANYQFFVTRNN